jgi:hypothetical protein
MNTIGTPSLAMPQQKRKYRKGKKKPSAVTQTPLLFQTEQNADKLSPPKPSIRRNYILTLFPSTNVTKLLVLCDLPPAPALAPAPFLP